MSATPLGPIVREVELAARPERAFALWTQPALLAHWWPEAAELDPEVGGRLRLMFPDHEVTGEFTVFDPPRALAFTWARADVPELAGTHVSVEITDIGGGSTRVVVVHDGWDALDPAAGAALRERHEGDWARFLTRLGDLVANTRAPSIPTWRTPPSA